MHMPSRLRHRLTLCLATSVLVAACGPSAPTPPSSPAGATAASPSTPAGPSGAAQPSRPASSAVASSPGRSAATTQTDTEWGRIWDALPAGFPRYPGSTVADDASAAPASARFAAQGGDVRTIATWFQSRLEAAAFRTQAFQGPLEDGSYVIDSVGSGTCRLEVTVAPTGGLTLITVRYGAACPNS